MSGGCVTAGDVRRPTYTAQADQLVRSFLTTLANFDLAYEHERAQLAASRVAPSLRARLLSRLEREHQARREPYVRHLALLREQHGRCAASGLRVKQQLDV